MNASLLIELLNQYWFEALLLKSFVGLVVVWLIRKRQVDRLLAGTWQGNADFLGGSASVVPTSASSWAIRDWGPICTFRLTECTPGHLPLFALTFNDQPLPVEAIACGNDVAQVMFRTAQLRKDDIVELRVVAGNEERVFVVRTYSPDAL